MRNDYTDITVVLDRSGSMETVAKDTRGGFDNFVAENKKVPGKCALTLIQFDTFYEFVHQGRPIQDVPPLDFHPRGGTALLDAVGRAITETGERLRNMPESERPGKVLFVIITDGEENSSHEYRREQVRNLIEQQQSRYNWQFVFLGASLGAFNEAATIGIPLGTTILYAHNAAGTLNSMNATVSNVMAYRSTGNAASLSYSAEQRKDALQDDDNKLGG